MIKAQSLPLIPPSQESQQTPSNNLETEAISPDASDPIDPNAPLIKHIVIEGTERVDPATVLNYLEIEAGDAYIVRKVNDAIKNLYATGLFSDVNIVFENETNKIIVKIVENSIINRIAFEGNEAIEDNILESEISLKPRRVFTRTEVQNAVKRILDLYRRKGRFAAKAVPKIIKKEQNRVDLVFEIEDGPVTRIEKINFIGNSFFSDSALKGAISSQENYWYRFLSDADRYDPDRLSFDKELLRNLYLKNGFIDFRVISAVAELTEDLSSFTLTFTLNEGQRFRFGDIGIISRIPDIKTQPLFEHITADEDDWYDISLIDESILNLIGEAGNLGYPFVTVNLDVNRDDATQKADIDFILEESQRAYVERINIIGNLRTVDEVIRRELVIGEGDPFNAELLRKSKQNVESLGYFSEVDLTTKPGSAEDRSIVDIDVTEQSTGELSLGVGVSSTDGTLIQTSLSERNLLGRGKILSVTATLARRRQDYNISYTEPWFADRPVSAGVDVFHTRRDLQRSSSFDQ
ncbi:MAG: outer membrane protein assembly factor BamA, partial [Pseudomonadota bacterium]